MPDKELKEAEFIKECTIRKCKSSDKSDDKPDDQQIWCLYTKHKPEKVLGRHPSYEKALNQEKAIKANGMKLKIAEEELTETGQPTEEELMEKVREINDSIGELEPKVNGAWTTRRLADMDLRRNSYESLKDNELDYKESEEHQELLQAYEEANINYNELNDEYEALYLELNNIYNQLTSLWQNAIPTPEAVQASKKIKAILKRAIGTTKMASNWDNPGQVMTEEEAMVELEQAWQNFGREYELMRDSAGSLEPQDPPVPGGAIAPKRELFSSFYPIKMIQKPEGTFYIKGHLKEAIGEPPGTTVSPTPRLPAISAPPGASSALTPKPSPEQPIPKKFVCPMDGKEYEEGAISAERDCPDHKGVKVIERKKLPPQAPGPKPKIPGIVPPLASIKVAWNAICFADNIVEKVQAGNLSTPDALKAMKEKAKEYNWGKEDTNYIKDRLQGKVAELYTKTAAYHNKEIVLCYKNDKYKLFDLDYGCITPDNAKEKDIKNQLLSFGIKDGDITEALKVSKNSQVTFHIKVAMENADYGGPTLDQGKDTATKDIDIAVTTATTELGFQAPRASLMMRAMDKFAELNSEELARAYQSEIKEKLTKELDAYDGARAELPGTNQEIGSQQGMNPIAFKIAATQEDIDNYFSKGTPLPETPIEIKEDLPPTYDIVQCAWCQKYMDKETHEYVEKPTEFEVVSHGICPTCEAKVMEEFLAEKEASKTIALDDSKKKELINRFKEQGITLSDSIEKKPKPWEVEDPRCLTAIGFSIKDKVRDQANPTLTGTILGFEGTNIRVAMDESFYCKQGAEGIYMPEALVKIEDTDSEDLNLW